MQQSYDPRNDDLQVWINGVISHRDEARINPFDSIAQGGDGVWEGLRLTGGRVFRLTEHLDRLVRSAKAMAFTQIPSHEFITAAIRECLAANDMHDDVHIRLTLSRGVKITSGMDPRLNQAGPTLIVLPEFKSPVYDNGGIVLKTASQRRARADMMDPKIHHNNLIPSILAKIEANAAGADDALMLDDLGFVAETNATHLFHVARGVLRTSTTRAIPEGITRDCVLTELAPALELPTEVGDFSLVDVYNADEVFVTGTMGGLTPVLTIDGRTIGTGEPGSITAALSKAYADLQDTTGTVVA